MELNIPGIIAAYNGVRNGDRMARYNPSEADPSMDPGRCIGCGGCASICPQNIAILDCFDRIEKEIVPFSRKQILMKP